MNRIAILGLGLMGGSLGRALKQRGFGGVVSGYARRPETREYAVAQGVVDEAWAEPGAAVRGADMVVVCVPILTTGEVLDACLADLSAPVVVTDVGSTKDWVCREAARILAGLAPFVGSHPICGSERQGVEAGRADLYEAATVVVTPGDGVAQAAAAAVVTSMWERVGARVVRMAPWDHDQMLARTSHLPHMIAALLAAVVGRGDIAAEAVEPYCGSGFRDTTRVAGGGPEVWLDILRTNVEAVANELSEYREMLDYLIRCLREGREQEVESFLVYAKQARDALTRETDRSQ